MPLTTPQGLITLSLRAAGILGVGQTALAEDYSDAFDVLNGLLGVWNRKRWLIWHLIDVPYLATGKQSYSVGPGGNFNVPRPDRLEAAYFRQYPGGVFFELDGYGNPILDGYGNPIILPPTPGSYNNPVDYPLEILQSREDYSMIALKTLTSWPTYIFYDSAFSQYSTPPYCGFVYPWPIPQASNYELHLILKDTLTQFTSYTQSINLPPEYTEALWTNLVIRLAAIYPGVQLTEAVVALAKSSMGTIRGANAQIPRLELPPQFVTRAKYNVFSDQTYQ